MIQLTHKEAAAPDVDLTVTLTFDQRQRSRLRVTLDDGREAGILLQRGTPLRDGEALRSDEGLVVRVVAAAETLSRVECPDALALARASYHLGNRHVPLRIESDCLYYQHDHVLDDLVRGLGLAVRVEACPFEPEPGAYQGPSEGTTHRHGHHHHGDD